MSITLNLSESEIKLIDDLLLLGIANGNTVNPRAFSPDGKEYKTLHIIRNKIIVAKDVKQ